MRKIILTGLCFLMAVTLFAQKEINDANAQTRDVKGFHAVRVSTGIQLIITQSTSEAVVVSAASLEDRDRIKTVVENGVLKIYYDYNFWKLLKEKGNRKLRAYVSIINIDDLHASSGARAEIEGSIKTDKMGLDASSGGVIKGRIEANSINADQSSGAVINISGSAKSLSIDGSSGSVFQGYDLSVDNCSADVSSGANASVTINKELSAEASSGGYIAYKGSAVVRNIRTSSGGHVSKK